LFVAFNVVAITVIVCSHHCLWPSLSLFAAVTVMVCSLQCCGHQCHCLRCTAIQSSTFKIITDCVI